MFKRIVATILLILFLNMNMTVQAANWVTITAENGKSADMDLDSIDLAVDAVEYNIRTINNGYVYVNRLSTELYKEGTPTAVIKRSKYKNSIAKENLITEDKITQRNYIVVKDGTLQAEIFDILSKKLGEKSFTKGHKTWEKYLKQQRKNIHYGWKSPSFSYLVATERENCATPVYENKITMKLDKDGKIIERYGENRQILLSSIEQLDPLPEDYNAETFELGVNIDYYKYAGAKLYNNKPAVKQISPVKAEIAVSKNCRPPIIGHIELGLLAFKHRLGKLSSFLFAFQSEPPENGFLCLILLPFVLLQCAVGITVELFEVVVSIFSLFVGVSFEDIIN